jgi:hypothetical protein
MGGWAQNLLTWAWRGVQLEAEISAARYVIRGHGREILAHAELRDLGGRRRADIGSFSSVSAARAACEADAERRCRREDARERPPIGVAISNRNGAPKGNTNGARRKADKPRHNTKSAEVSDAARLSLDAALAAFADVLADE